MKNVIFLNLNKILFNKKKKTPWNFINTDYSLKSVLFLLKVKKKKECFF